MEENIKKIEKILLTGNIQDNLDFIIQEIPEVTYMIGFEHKHPHHHLNVWEHTVQVIENVESNDIEIKMAALLHDIGKPFSYQDEEVRHFHGHPKISAQMAEAILKRLGYDESFIQDVCYLVKMHDTKIDPYHLDNTYEMIQKRLKLQYADAKAHAPEKIGKRIKLLNIVASNLEEKYGEKTKKKSRNYKATKQTER